MATTIYRDMDLNCGYKTHNRGITMLTCSKGTCVAIKILSRIFTEQGSLYLCNKRTYRGKHPLPWSQISSHAIIILTNSSYQPSIPILYSRDSNIPSQNSKPDFNTKTITPSL